MKIKNSKIFKADIYKAVNYVETEFLGGDVSIGGANYDEKLIMKGAVVIEFGGSYVLINNVDTLAKYWDVKSHVAGENSLNAPDRRFLSSMPVGWNLNYVKNVEPMFENDGKTDVKGLLNIHRQHCGDGGREL